MLVLVGYREDSVAVKASPLSFRIRPKLTRPRKFDQPSAQINNRPKWSRRKLGIRKERQKNVAEPVPSTIADMNEHCKGESLIRGRTGFFYGIGEDLLQRGNEVLCKDKNDPNIRDSTEDGDLNAAGDVKINEYSSTADHIAAGLSKTDRVEHDKDVPRIFDRSTILREDREIAGFRDVMSEVVDEFQKTASDLRENIILLREEMAELNKNYRHRKSNDELDENRLGADDGLAFENLEEERYRNKRSCRSKGLVTIQQRRKRQVEFDELADTVEEWANNLVREGGSAEHGWKEVECMKLFRSKYNANGTTKCYIKVKAHERFCRYWFAK